MRMVSWDSICFIVSKATPTTIRIDTPENAIWMFQMAPAIAGNTAPVAAAQALLTDEETARETLGTSGTVASGRMSLTFAIEMLRRYFGSDVYNHGGFVDLRFLRPVRPGDEITFSGKIIDITREANGSRISVEIKVENQKGDTTGIGEGSAVVPNAYLPAEE